MPQRPRLPRKQLAVLFVMLFSDVLTQYQSLPYVPYLMSLHSGLAPDSERVALLSGVYNALFYLTLLFSAPVWGKLSDRVGRKWILLMGMTCNVVTLLILGLANSLWLTMLSRALLGCFNANLPTFKAAMGEMVERRYRAIAFGVYGTVFSVGGMVAPLVGGWLYDHTTESRPAILPCVVTAAAGVVGWLCCLFLFKETWTPRAASEGELQSGVVALCRHHRMAVLVCCLYGAGTMIMYSFQTVFPLWASLEPHDDGWNWEPSQVGVALSVVSLGGLISQAFLFPLLVRRFGAGATFRWGWVLPILVFGTWPLLDMVPAQPPHLRASVLYSELFLKGVTLTAAMFSLNVLISSMPSHWLGVTNGLAQSFKGLLGTFGPIGMSGVFAASMASTGSGLDQNLSFVVLAALCMVVVLLAWRLPDSLHDGPPEDVVFQEINEEDVAIDDKDSDTHTQALKNVTQHDYGAVHQVTSDDACVATDTADAALSLDCQPQPEPGPACRPGRDPDEICKST